MVPGTVPGTVQGHNPADTMLGSMDS